MHLPLKLQLKGKQFLPTSMYTSVQLRQQRAELAIRK